ncbi:MAG: NAD+ synthase [Leptolyngbyaceae bacterium]|nr:NAD+ synthase [Leptolyngbyaceae bacterium]
MRIAIAQLNPTIGDLAGNTRQILAAARQAADMGARLMLTPELSISGYSPRDLLLRPGFITDMGEAIAQLATTLPPDLAVLVGTAEPNPYASQKGGKALFNSILWLAEGQIQRSFHKRLLPTYDVFDDERYFQPDPQTGNQHNIFTLDGLTIGVTICEDLWNDEDFWGKRSYAQNPLADLADQNVDLIVNLSGSPYYMGKQQVREAMLSHGAKRYQTPILYVNQVGGNDDLIFDGNSVGFNRQGDLVYRAPAFKPTLQLVEWAKPQQDLRPAAIASAPSSGEAELWNALVMGVQDYAHKCGFSSAVLGLSGGIDSALVAAIATAALGAANVLGILMPSPYSSGHSVSDALDLAQNLGISTHQLAIGELMQGYDHTLEALFAGTEFGVAEENLQSRIRGNVLMAIANKFGHLLLSTGNKSEMAVGYCTLYGDMNGGLAVIADVPKTRVYTLCHWLNQPEQVRSLLPQRPDITEMIPTHIITKPPSAELKPNQVDQDSLPTYEILDDILERLVNQHQSPTTIINAGHDAHTVDQVVRLVKRAEFKRRQAPPGLKVTDRAFGTGWRMPIAARY